MSPYICKMLYFVLYLNLTITIYHLSEFHVCRLIRSIIKHQISCERLLLSPHCICRTRYSVAHVRVYSLSQKTVKKGYIF